MRGLPEYRASKEIGEELVCPFCGGPAYILTTEECSGAGAFWSRCYRGCRFVGPDCESHEAAVEFLQSLHLLKPGEIVVDAKHVDMKHDIAFLEMQGYSVLKSRDA